MAKINMISKSKKHGSQFVTLSAVDHDLLGDSYTDGIEELIEEKISIGHSIAEFKGSTCSLFYVSRKTDGFAREVTENNWNRKMILNVFEPSQSVWEANVDKYFAGMLNDADTKAELNAIARPALILPPINGNTPFDLGRELENVMEWLKSQCITKNGTSGKRRSNVWNWLCGNGTQYGRPSARVKSAVATYVYKNTPKQKTWKK